MYWTRHLALLNHADNVPRTDMSGVAAAANAYIALDAQEEDGDPHITSELLSTGADLTDFLTNEPVQGENDLSIAAQQAIIMCTKEAASL